MANIQLKNWDIYQCKKPSPPKRNIYWCQTSLTKNNLGKLPLENTPHHTIRELPLSNIPHRNFGKLPIANISHQKLRKIANSQHPTRHKAKHSGIFLITIILNTSKKIVANFNNYTLNSIGSCVCLHSDPPPLHKIRGWRLFYSDALTTQNYQQSKHMITLIFQI